MRYIAAPPMKLGIPGFTFDDLFSPQGLQRLDGAFLAELEKRDAALCQALLAQRQKRAAPECPARSAMLMAVAQHLGDFVARLYDVEKQRQQARQQVQEQGPIFRM